ncbi:2'-5' RNA ligase superfamily protein [Sarocladium implicatum]|nr:2'-5' RNA ligase superfamily protein [Sarocladium implicatum]
MEEAGVATYSKVQEASYDTALCLLPPRDTWAAIDRLRALNDKAYGRWPPHVNLIYPFVHRDALPAATEVLSQIDYADIAPLHVALTEADCFAQKQANTMHIRPHYEADDYHALKSLVERLNRALGRKPANSYRPHLTVAQSTDTNKDANGFLMDKARLLTPLTWDTSELAILVRDQRAEDDDAVPILRPWGTIELATGRITRESPVAFYEEDYTGRAGSHRSSLVRQQEVFNFSSSARTWNTMTQAQPPSIESSVEGVQRLIVASYNVLAEFEWPPASTRYPHLVSNICASRAAADILVLQEVTDAFLDHLLSDAVICERYPFATHGRPGIPHIGPLPNLLNIVVLSKHPLRWEYLEHARKHKGSAIVSFPTIRLRIGSEGEPQPLILAACHLSQGLTDGSVTAKKQEVQEVIKRLQNSYAGHPWLLAGDFNMTTSSFTIGMAKKKGALSNRAQQQLREIDGFLLDCGFRDVWLDTRLETGESSGTQFSQEDLGQLHEGEQGATFDPQSNTLAAKQTGYGLNTRPQRYDRIFVSNNFGLRPAGFNMFGQDAVKLSEDRPAQHASDHWGIRCLLQAMETGSTLLSEQVQGSSIAYCKAPSSLGDLDDLRQCLARRGLIPTPEEASARTEAIGLLRRVLADEMVSQSKSNSQFKPVLVLVPVGSTALGVWTPKSDIDCLCIGGISSKTFFALALKRLRRATSEGIVIVRKVQANSGIMLELIVQGIRFDLQYCPAINIAEQCPDVFNRPSTDPAFALPMQTLLKLKPARDLSYLRRSIPDMAQYRAAHALIKAWATSRGLYAAKLGYLGGIHISVLLVPVCKSLARAGHSVSVCDIVATFFHHYAEVEWEKQLVFDPFFHKKTKYHRSFREPLCLLGWHAPALNTAATASVPTVRTLAAEFRRAADLLKQKDIDWDGFLGTDHGEAYFLSRYSTYVKVDVHYWGPSPSKGNKLVGWIESRCAMLLVDLDRRVPTLLPRIWPQRFVRELSKSESTTTEYQGCYLIGLERRQPQTTGRTDTDPKLIESTLITVLQDFEAKLTADESYFDPQTCWLSLTLQRGPGVGALEADQGPWGGTAPPQDESELAFDSDDEEFSGEDTFSDDDEGNGATATPRSKTGASAAAASLPHRGAKPSFAGLGKFRTATDVLNRLRWDAAMDSSDFMVGYDDRFAGAQEKALDKWKSDFTHEEFIPQHRILYFKRRSDGVKVWERSTRTDSIFGSGIRE